MDSSRVTVYYNVQKDPYTGRNVYIFQPMVVLKRDTVPESWYNVPPEMVREMMLERVAAHFKQYLFKLANECTLEFVRQTELDDTVLSRERNSRMAELVAKLGNDLIHAEGRLAYFKSRYHESLLWRQHQKRVRKKHRKNHK